MAYYLENVNADGHVKITAYTIGANVGDYIEFIGYANSGNPGGNYRLVGDQPSFFANLIELQSGSLLFRADSTANINFSTGYTQPAVGAEFTVRLERAAAGVWEAFLDAASLGTASIARNFTFDQFLRFAASTTECFLGGIKKITVKDGATTRVYDPSLSGGTGTILPTDDGVNEGTQGGTWPADDSEWVFYDDGAGGEDTLTANDISSTSQVSSPAIDQTHALTAVSVESVSDVTNPSIGQDHGLTAVSVDSQSATSNPALGQSHNLAATDTQSTSELTQPALSSASTVDSLSADDISSVGTTSAPALGQVHNLAANDATSSTETGTPTLQQEHALTSVSLDSLSTVTSPALTEIAGQDTLSANDVEATSTVTSPTLAQVHVLQPNNAQAQTETSEPAIAQTHTLTANDVISASQVSSPTLRDASQVLVTPIKNTKATVSQITYKAAIIQPVYKAEAG